MRVLDLGAGGNPDIRATDCVDFQSRQEIDKLTKKVAGIFYYFLNINNQKQKLGKAETLIQIKIMPNIKKKRGVFKIDYTKGLPYKDNTFDIVTSHNSLSYGYPVSYNHVIRVLKVGGRVEIYHANHNFVIKSAEELKRSGFNRVLVKNGVGDLRIFDKMFDLAGLMKSESVSVAVGYK
jgi:SAM-dependent methyltransferase